MSEANVHLPSESAVRSLQEDVEKAVILLRKLAGQEKSHDVGKSQRLPVQELTLAHGLAFFESNKGGLIASVVQGRGFLIKKVKGGHGWSAPVLFKLGAVGIGAAFGFSSTESVMILDDDKAVDDFLHTQVTLDSDMTLAAGSAARHMHAPEVNLSHPTDTFRGAVYSIANGAMVDVSLQGVKVSIREKDMHKLYGPDSDDKTVLHGKMPPPTVMEPLLNEIHTLIATDHSRISHPNA